jgi:hypothetical protein
MIFKNGTVASLSCVERNVMPRLRFRLSIVATLSAAVFAFAVAFSGVAGAASPAPSPVATETAASNKDAGTIEGEVTQVDVTPGKTLMVVKSGAQTFAFAVLAGTSVKGPTGDFAVDVKVGSRVSVSASKSGTTYTAQIVRVLPSAPGHPAH